MAKIDVAALKAAGFTSEQIAKVQAVANAKAPLKAKAKIQDYTTANGQRYKAIHVNAGMGVFVKVDDAQAVIAALTEGLARAQAGEVDEVKMAKAWKEKLEAEALAAAAQSENPTE